LRSKLWTQATQKALSVMTMRSALQTWMSNLVPVSTPAAILFIWCV
jgi:hypothetical protein